MLHVPAETLPPAAPSVAAGAFSSRHWPHWLAAALLTLLIGGVGATIESHRRPLPENAPVVLLAPLSRGGVLERIKARGEVVRLAPVSDRVRVVAGVAESELAGLRAGLKVRFFVPAYKGRTFVGEVERLGAISIASDGVRRGAVEIAVREGADDLRPGMSAQVEIEVRSAPAAFRAPVAALDFSPAHVAADGAPPSLWLSVGASLRQIPVEVRASDGRFAEVIAPELSEGAGVAVGYASTRPARP